MSPDNILVYGAGGHGKVVADILLAAGRALAGFVDDGKPAGTVVMGLPVLGDGKWLFSAPVERFSVALGIGSSSFREHLVNLCRERGLPVITAMHPKAVVSRSAKVGCGAAVMANAVINPDAIVGIGAIVNTAAVVEHDVVVGDFAHVGPNATLTGAARLGSHSVLWTGAVVLPGVSIGTHSVVGAGAVVRENLPDGIVAAGVPARVLSQSTIAAR